MFESASKEFFQLPANTNILVRRIANCLELKNKSKEFIDSFASTEGFAIWNKPEISISNNSNTANSFSSNAVGTKDTIVIIPLV